MPSLAHHLFHRSCVIASRLRYGQDVTLSYEEAANTRCELLQAAERIRDLETELARAQRQLDPRRVVFRDSD